MAVTEMFALMALVLGLAGVAGGLIFAFYRTRSKLYDTIRRLVEDGNSVSRELVQTLTNLGRTKPVYLRRGVLLVAVGLALVFFAFIAQPEQRGFMGLSAFPLFVGFGYLILWWVTPEQE